ncbi:MAG TPA: uroporphyrinogen-III synthase [Candidatus Paceibacterota bacterium]|jgi:uroporphyrinogen-III synthase|nr:uroporphyrinogen-III synthase [Candidatus Paceibacterota bacterium]
MKSEFEVRIDLKKLPLSRTSVRAMRHLDHYDAVILTSKNAKKFFMQELRQRCLPRPRRIIQVGPRADLLTFELKGQRILFPRSKIAPFAIVRKLRAKGVTVRVMPLYTVKGVPLSRTEKKQLLSGAIKRLYIKSPSGAEGLLRHFRGKERTVVLSIRVRCIGKTTARTARQTGFRHVSIR